MISQRIKTIRDKNNMSQYDLARKLGITRSSVNAWEQGISVPSTQYLVELAKLFSVSTDYLLDLEDETPVKIAHLTEDQQRIIVSTISAFESVNEKNEIIESLTNENQELEKELKAIKQEIERSKPLPVE